MSVQNSDSSALPRSAKTPTIVHVRRPYLNVVPMPSSGNRAACFCPIAISSRPGAGHRPATSVSPRRIRYAIGVTPRSDAGLNWEAGRLIAALNGTTISGEKSGVPEASVAISARVRRMSDCARGM